MLNSTTIIPQIFLLGAAVFTFKKALGLHFKYQESKMETLRDFYVGFFSLSLSFFLLALPQLVLFSPLLIQIDFILTDILFLFTELRWGVAMFKILEHPNSKKIFLYIIFVWLLIYIFLNWIFFSPSLPLTSEGKTYYWTSGTFWLQGINRGLLVLGALILSTIFFKWMEALKEKKLFFRSFIIGASLILTATGGFIFCFLPHFYFSPILLLFSTVLNFLGISICVVFCPKESNNLK